MRSAPTATAWSGRSAAGVLTDPGRPLRDLHARLDDARVRLRQAELATPGRAAHRFALASADCARRVRCTRSLRISPRA